MSYIPREEGYGQLKVLWLEPKVQWQGKGIITALGEEMERQKWELVKDKAHVGDCDMIFFGSDSQLSPDLLNGNKPTVLYFWGWLPQRLLNKDFQAHAMQQLKLMAKCTKILVPSWPVLDQLADFGLPGELCRPGINTVDMDATLAIEMQGGAYPTVWTTNNARVMFISRLAEHKGLELLIQALSLLEPRPETIICGPGDRKPYRELADELKVPLTFLSMSDTEKTAALSQASVLVHPSFYEGFGMPPLEALYCGKPVIVFDTPQMRHMLQESAFFFSSVEGLAQLIAGCCGPNPDEKAVIAAKVEQGRRMVANTLTLPQFAERLWAYFHQAIKAHLAKRLYDKPSEWKDIYDAEHRRNWAYSINRFDPTWSRHWRATAYVDMLKQCEAKNVLDVGSGSVYPTILARAGFQVTALDISTECLRQVNDVAAKWGVGPAITTQQGDAQCLPFKTDTFDAVIQGEIWEHIPDLEAVIKEGLRVLKSGGYLISSTPCGQHHFDPMHIRLFDDKNMGELLSVFTEKAKLAKLISLSKIAEDGADPSCYLVILEKLSV